MGLCREKIDWMAHHYKGWVTVFAFMIVLITGCGEQGLTIDAVKSTPQDGVLHQGKPVSDSVLYYFEQAQLGIGDAYVRMAQFYLDGTLGAQPSKGGNNGLYGRGIYGDTKYGCTLQGHSR